MLSKAISNAEKVTAIIESSIDGLAMQNLSKGKAYGAVCFSLVTSHFTATVSLLSDGHYATTVALIRVHFETYIRGCWLSYIADDKQIAEFERGFLPPFKTLVAQVEKHPAFNVGVLSNVAQRSWKLLNDFTHTGVGQIMRNISDGVVDQNYSEAELIDALSATQAYGLLAASQLASLSGNIEIQTKLLDVATALPKR